jgi:hypothetical protein
MKIKINSSRILQTFGENTPKTVNAGDILEVEEIESHENDENSVDIHLEDGTILMYVPVTCYDELPMA